MKRILYLVILFLFNFNSNAQVGIENPVPTTGSILDLSNATNDALVLPKSAGPPSSVGTFAAEAMLFYYQNNLHLKTSSGITVLSPWLHDGVLANGTYIPSGTTVGVGVAPIASSPVKLQIENSADVVVGSSNASIGIGLMSSNNMLIDNDEILVKTNGTTAGVLKLQEDGGTVEIRMGAASTTTVLKANGSIDAAGLGDVLQNGLDLIAPGSIFMWYGAVDGSGYPLVAGVPNTNWKICDGTGGTPDLRERFIVGAGGNNGTVPGAGYSNGNTGGEVTHTLSITELPAHNHPGGTTSSDGAHSHTTGSIPNGGEGYILSFNSANEVYKWASTTSITSSSDGSHSHTLNITSEGGGNAHENRPPYFGLIYIIKL